MIEAVEDRFDLELKPEQRAKLQAIHSVHRAVARFRGATGQKLAAALAPILADAAKAAIGSTRCPFDHPPEPIILGFDRQRNMYLHCLHAPRHCWTTSGQSITCPHA